jgi:hypothetical protein
VTLSAEDALAAVMQVASLHQDQLGWFPTRLRVGADIWGALLRDEATNGRILLNPKDPDSWVMLVGDHALPGPAVRIEPQGNILN